MTRSGNLTAIGVTATSSAAVVTVATEGTTYTTSLSGGATETLTLGTNANGNTTLVVGGKATNGDTVTVVTHNPLLPGGQESVGYTVGASDTLVDVAAGLVSNMNGNSDLQTLGVTAKNSCTADLAFSQSFSGNGNLPSGESLAKVSATDAVPTTKTDTNSLNVTASASATLTWDANGNMTSDGTNSYKWDAENRLIEVDYPGVNNYSLFSYDGLWRNSTLIEVVSGSMASTKQFIWNSTIRCEERDGSGSVASRYFGRGQTISASAYYYASDNLGSVRELTNSSGIIEAQYLYGPYGERSKLAGSSESTFQFGGFYAHLRSDKYLAVLRAYSSKDGRWISRDPMGGETLSKLGASGLAETNTGPSLYAYVKNGPLDSVDPIGLELHKCCENPAPMPPKGDQSPCEKYGSELYAGLLESCFCRCMGDGDWANKFRGCLACEKAQGAGVHQRHVDCGKAFPPPGPVEVATLGLCTLKCIAVTSPLVQPMSGPTTFLGAGKGASSSAGAGI